MRAVWVWVGVVLAALALGGCKKRAATDATEWFGLSFGHGHGRYVGVGIYAPETPWTRMVAAQQKAETPAAQPLDDQAIIVVVDSATGEVRSCGDLTGYCIGMDPWKTPLAAGHLAPIDLTEHAGKDHTDPAPAASAAPAERG